MNKKYENTFNLLCGKCVNCLMNLKSDSDIIAMELTVIGKKTKQVIIIDAIKAAPATKAEEVVDSKSTQGQNINQTESPKTPLVTDEGSQVYNVEAIFELKPADEHPKAVENISRNLMNM